MPGAACVLYAYLGYICVLYIYRECWAEGGGGRGVSRQVLHASQGSQIVEGRVPAMTCFSLGDLRKMQGGGVGVLKRLDQTKFLRKVESIE